MGLEQVRMFCMFDLPMETHRDRRQYQVFRKELLSNGFVMLQYSVYYRTLPNRSALKKYEKIIGRVTPKFGHVRLLYVTEAQFQSMLLLSGVKDVQEIIVGNNRLVVI